MTTALNSAISVFAHSTTVPKADAMRFLDEKLASMPASDIPENSRNLSRFFAVIVLIPKSAIEDEQAPRKPSPNKSLTDVTTNVCSQINAARAWLKNSNATDTFEFGGVKGRLSTMEIHRDGRPVALTCKEFKTLAYLIKNPRRVISRNELLNEVWGYENYPRTRTVDNHILKLRTKLESKPGHPKHFHTIHCAGYTFLP
jgi:DNA-binding winged helix-turn-helix (wHTH) protein